MSSNIDPKHHNEANYFTSTNEKQEGVVSTDRCISPFVSLLHDLGLSPSLPVPFPRRLSPPLLILGSSLFFSGMYTCVRYVACDHTIPSYLITVLCGISQFGLVTLLTWLLGPEITSVNLSRKSKILLVLRGIVGSLSVIAKIEALARLPVLVVTSLFATTPVFAALQGWILIGEKMTRVDIFALCLSTFASILVGVPGGDAGTGITEMTLERSHIIGVLFGLLGGLTTASIYTITREMGENVHFLRSLFVHSLAVVLLSVVLTFVNEMDIRNVVQFYENPQFDMAKAACLSLFGPAFFYCLGSLFQSKGSQLLPAGRVGVLRAFDAPINIFAALLFLGEYPQSTPQLMGCALIMVSTGVMAYHATYTWN